jgi:hypothetical protein
MKVGHLIRSHSIDDILSVTANIDIVNVFCDVVISNQYNIYAIKFVSDLGQFCEFLWILRFPPPIKLTATI